MRFEIQYLSGGVAYTADLDAALETAPVSVQLGAAIQLAVSTKANLRGADLRGADLRGVYLRGADLRAANLYGADLGGADLGGADLCRANLCRANLYGNNLREADLREANLHGANLREADLYRANLRGADLGGADLGRANLHGADLGGANLRESNLRESKLRAANLGGATLDSATKIDTCAAARTIVAPPEGEIIGWKKCMDNKVVKLRIPATARRSNATGRKCRAEFVEVLEIRNANGRKVKSAVSNHDKKTKYVVGKTVRCAVWCEDRWQECAGGIHFFITRDEAEDY